MEKRKETRVEYKVKLLVHVHQCDHDPDLVGVSIECKAVDISTSGLRLITNQKLTPRTILNIIIGIGDASATYYLRGYILYVTENFSRVLSSPSGLPDRYFIGVSLLDEEGTDVSAWVDQFGTNIQSLI